jgi:hypothetical protein
MFEKHGLEAIAQAASDTEDAREWPTSKTP